MTSRPHLSPRALSIRRNLLRSSALLAAPIVSTLSRPAAAQATFPSRAVTLVVPHSAAGSPSQVARILARHAQEALGQPCVVEPKIGAGGMVGMAHVVRQPADGHTLLFMDSSAYAITPHIYRNPMVDPVRELVPVAAGAHIPYVFAVASSLNVSSLREFVALAKQKPDMFYGSSGNGTPHHLATEMLKTATGIQLQHVPFAGATQAAVALGSGEVQAGFFALQSAQPIEKAGKLKIIAVSSAQRMAQLPNVATVAEAGYPGFDLISTVGLYAPAATPRGVIARLYDVFSEGAKSKEAQAAVDTLALIPARPMTQPQFAAFSRAENETFGKLVKAAKVQID